MFPYDSTLAATIKTAPETINDVLFKMRAIDGTCVDGDGLKWFNWLYLQVTEAVEQSVGNGVFNDRPWLSQLDVRFASLYFNALGAALSSEPCPKCWEAMFAVRNQPSIARIQFAFAGMNAHINHDLPFAIITTCRDTNTVPHHGTPQYNDYTAVNTILGGLIDSAKQVLNVRLLGDSLPAVSHLGDLIAAWDVAAFREKAWQNAEGLWNDSPIGFGMVKSTIDGITEFASKALLVPVP